VEILIAIAAFFVIWGLRKLSDWLSKIGSQIEAGNNQE